MAVVKKSRTVVISSAPTWFIYLSWVGVGLVGFDLCPTYAVCTRPHPAAAADVASQYIHYTPHTRTLVLMTERPRRTVSLIPCMPRRIFSIRTFSMS